MRRLLPVLGPAAGAAILILAGCHSQDTGKTDESPADRLAEAKKSFDAADFIGFHLATDSLPDGVDGLLDAEGTGTHAPAFTGTVKVHTHADITADLVAIGGKVYAKLPFVGWTDLDPGDYGAPDPADLMDASHGISSLFTATRQPTEASTERAGSDVVTVIDGKLPGEAVHGIFPSAATDDFTVSYTITDDDDVTSARITGPFYGHSGTVTYTIALDLAAASVTITPPQ